MSLCTRFLAGAFLCLDFQGAIAQQAPSRPGFQPYTPNRIEWLVLVLQTQLRQDQTVDSPFSLNVVATDHETILIFVTYQPNADRVIMNMAVDTARKVIQITTKGYGWSSWVKIKERIEMVKPKGENP